MPAATTISAPLLKRSLSRGSLVLYRIILIQPTAPMPLFGVAYEKAGGHEVFLALIGKVAMLFTGLSCGRMANVYPNAGSAYASRGFHASPGYLTGGVGAFHLGSAPWTWLILRDGVRTTRGEEQFTCYRLGALRP